MGILMVADMIIGCETSRPGADSQESKQRYSTSEYLLELESVELFDDGVTLQFLYTNRATSPRSTCWTPAATYLIDNFGQRYASKLGSRCRWFQPQVAEKFSIGFARVRRDASWVSLALSWNPHIAPAVGRRDDAIVMRKIALKQ
jgi:hypothetical protein